MYCERSLCIRILKSYERLRPFFDDLGCKLWWEDIFKIQPPAKGEYIDGYTAWQLSRFQQQILGYVLIHSHTLPQECKKELKVLEKHYKQLKEEKKTARSSSSKS